MAQSAALEQLGISTSVLATRGLHEFQEANILEVAEVGEDGREHLLIPEAAAAWRLLKQAALKDDIRLHIVSAFRSIERQTDIIKAKLKAGKGIEEILSVSAPPGFSEHHTGRAVDLAVPTVPALEVSFAQTPAFHWLQRHAQEFRFSLSYPSGNASGYQFEPWHWCYSAVQQAVPQHARTAV